MVGQLSAKAVGQGFVSFVSDCFTKKKGLSLSFVWLLGRLLLLLLLLAFSLFCFTSQDKDIDRWHFNISNLRLVQWFLYWFFVVVEMNLGFCCVLWISHINGRFCCWIGCPFIELTQIIFLEEYGFSQLLVLCS